MKIDECCSAVINTVPKALAAGVVDMGTGMLLDVKTTDSHPSEVLDMVAAATKDLFEGETVTEVENTFRKIRGDKNTGRYFKEIIVNSTNLIHVFIRIPSAENIVVTVVCRIDANLGMVLTKARTVVHSIEA